MATTIRHLPEELRVRLAEMDREAEAIHEQIEALSELFDVNPAAIERLDQRLRDLDDETEEILSQMR